MEGRARTSAAIFILCSILLPGASAQHERNGGLRVGFYDKTCPRAEEIVAEVVSDAYKKNRGIAAGFLRILFHDCFVHGCDASILLDATPSGGETEKESVANAKSLRGLEVIDAVKDKLESECPGIVSCADTLTFATRDGSVLAGVPHYPMAGGRRDGLVSRKDDVILNMASPDLPVRNITELFVRKGLTQEEMVILTGAHSIGIAHCPTFLYRIQDYNETHRIDPKLDAADAFKIISTCQQVSSEKMVEASLPLDAQSPFKMDNSFYKNLLKGKSLIESDSAMSDDPMTRPIMERVAADEKKWLTMFGRAMARLAAVDVKTGTKGEIRKNCRFVNSHKFSSTPVRLLIPATLADIGQNLSSSDISSSEVIPSDNIGSAQDFIISMT
ncbi:Peroxidase [Actinidia chinensis var. chinensis]|uniref:Peroxidase n=1 Tax=Actinidia chinensis var. chinensis TaxID=1590841 RepID=A0A2R6RER1_ACTCC|nr:Peroxidase [Actinidia chinensis var. chinensis]